MLSLVSRSLAALMRKEDLAGVRSFLAKACNENDLDYLTVTDLSGKVLVRAFYPDSEGKIPKEDVSSNPLVSTALSGAQAMGIRKLTVKAVIRENPNLKARLAGDFGMVVEAAYPVSGTDNGAAVLYGGGKNSESIEFEERELHRLIHSDKTFSTVLKVQVDGREQMAIIKELQRDTLSLETLHLDLLRIAMDSKIQVQIPVHLLNVDQVKKKGGILQQLLTELQIACMPLDIPEFIPVEKREGVGE